MLSAKSAATATSALAAAPDPMTKIEKLWAKRQKVRKEYEENRKVRKRLERELARRMPKPDQSIVYGVPENDADGLEYYGARRFKPHTLHHYIWSDSIKRELGKLKTTRFEAKKTTDNCVTLIEHKKPLPLSKRQLALRERLKARLKLSRSYERKIGRISAELGLPVLEKRSDKLIDRQVSLEGRILSTQATLRCDFAIKLAINKHYNDGCGADEIARDLQRLVDLPGAFSKAFGFDPNAPVPAPVEA